MGYRRLDELESDPVQETTAVTMRSIKEILAETGDTGLLMGTSEPAPEPAAEPKPEPAAKAKPAAQAAAPKPAPAAQPAAPAAAPRAKAPRPAPEPTVSEAQRMQSLTERLASRLFGR